MSFLTRPWLLAIYKDHAPYQVFQKSVQCGISERTIIEALNHAINGKSVLYVLPTLEVRNDFVNNRIDKIVENVRYYREAMHGSDNTGLKHFGRGTIKFVGSNVLMSFKEYPADVVIVDELDQCNQENLVYIDDRLSGVSFRGFEPIIRKISNPSVSGYGINKEYDASDKKQWHVRCEHCGEWQPLDWFKNVVNQVGDNEYRALDENDAEGRELFVYCRACHKAIDRFGCGEWVAEYPDNPISGYHISKLITEQTSVKQLYIKFCEAYANATRKEHFINSELGLPYSGEGDKLSYADFTRCTTPAYHLPLRASEADGNRIVAGIDVGAVLHIRIDRIENNKRVMLYAGQVPNFTELESVLKKYSVYVYVMDEKPEMHKAREFVTARRGGFLCNYTEPKSSAPFKPDVKTREIKVNRTASLDEATATYIDGKIQLPEDWQSLDNGEWVRQMIAPTRLLDMKQHPPVYYWDEGGQPDHHRHADNYCHMAAKILGFGAQYRAEMIWI